MPQQPSGERGESDEVAVVPVAPVAPEPVVVRRSVAWSLPLGAAAAFVAIAYLGRASDTGSLMDWALCLGMTAVALVHLAALVDARTPLLVADELGVRIRLGAQWRGLPWDAVERVVVQPRPRRFRDGRLLVIPHILGRQLDGLDRRSRRQAAHNQRIYGAALVVPLGLVTRVTAAAEEQLADRIAALSEGRADVIALIDQPASSPGASPQGDPGSDPAFDSRGGDSPAKVRLGGLGEAASRLLRSGSRSAPRQSGVAEEPAPIPLEAPAAVAVPLREIRRSVRADITSGAAALRVESLHEEETRRLLPEERQLRREGAVDLEFEPVFESNVRPIARMGEPVAPLVIDDFGTEPSFDPIIGPELVAARHRVGLTVDELADRTRIRPHVIEAIDVDDFAPCGGDVYARGHLRTLARSLGKDPEPLIATFDNRYAQAPISARRVFEAELATGMTGSMRSTVGGPNWGLLVGLVLTLVLVWGVVRLFAAEPAELVEDPAPIPGAKAWPPRVYDAPPPPVTSRKTALELVAVNASTRVQVTDVDGNVLFDQQLVLGESKRLRVPPRVTVSADNGGALSVTWGKQELGLLGEPDRPAERKLLTSAE